MRKSFAAGVGALFLVLQACFQDPVTGPGGGAITTGQSLLTLPKVASEADVSFHLNIAAPDMDTLRKIWPLATYGGQQVRIDGIPAGKGREFIGSLKTSAGVVTHEGRAVVDIARGEVAKVSLRLERVKGSAVVCVEIEGMPSSEDCDGDLAVYDTLVFYPSDDGSIDSEDYNLGFGSQLRLHSRYLHALGLMEFDGIQSGIGEVVSAELEMKAFTDSKEPYNAEVKIYRTHTGWEEGTGHWYWFDGSGKNGFAYAYSNFPSYVAPHGTTNPAIPSGLIWSSSQALRDSMIHIGTDSISVPPTSAVSGKFPTAEETGSVRLDVTKAFEGGAKPLTLVLQQASVASGVSLHIYTKDHMDPAIYAPKLTLVVRR